MARISTLSEVFFSNMSGLWFRSSHENVPASRFDGVVVDTGCGSFGYFAAGSSGAVGPPMWGAT